MGSFIQIKNVSYFYAQAKDKMILKDINLNINQGEFVAVLGHNGSGKSTLAKHLNAILLPEKGKVYVDGIDTSNEDELFKLRQTVGMVFQNPDNQIVATIVEEDVAFAPENLGLPQAQIRERVDSALKAVNMLKFKDSQPHRLSGGQKQRVAIAGVIAMRPKCLVLDEPTAMLDPVGRREVINTIKQLNEKHKITIILITHYMNEAIMADRVVVMDRGAILMDDVPKKVFSQVELLKSVGLDVPQTTELMHRLRLAGVDVKDDVLSEKECVNALISMLGGLV